MYDDLPPARDKPDRPCADHFVGSETLTCATCGWNEAMGRYSDELRTRNAEFTTGTAAHG